MVLRKNQQNIL